MRYRFAMPVAVLATVAAAAAAAALSAPAGDRILYEAGLQAVLKMRWEDAATALAQLLAAHPGSPYCDDALYWRAFARAESGDCGSAYADLQSLEERFPASSRRAAARALRVRCAGQLLAAHPQDPRRADYARLIAEATRSEALPARLSAAEVLLTADPPEGARALRAVAAGLKDRTLLEVLLDRHFGDSLAIARPADPSLRLGPANAVVLVRRQDGVETLSVPEALRAARDPGDPTYTARARADLERALEGIRRASVSAPAAAADERSRVVQIEDTEIHLYRGTAEAVRILVLNRQQGFSDENIRVFVERQGRTTELTAREAERMAEAGDTSAMGARALTFVGSSLALIRLDLGAIASLGGPR